MTELEEACDFFNEDQYAIKTTGIEISAVGKQYAKCTLNLDQRHLNAAGRIMGGVYYTLADFTFAVAANFKGTPTVTTVSQINYLGVPKGKKLVSESRLIKDGHFNCIYEITISDEEGNIVAVVMSTGMHILEKIDRN